MKINLAAKVALGVLLLSSSQLFSQEILTGANAIAKYGRTDMVRTGKHSSAPSYVHFQKGQEIDLDDFKNWTKKNFRMNPAMDFTLINTETDKLGQLHYRYQQTFNGTPVEYAVWMVHTKNDKVLSMNGLIYPELTGGNASISEDAARNAAISFVGANVYKWELPAEEAHVKRETGDPNATYFPIADLVYVSEEVSFTPESYRLAYKFNIYAHEPVSRAYIYVDASSGEIIWENEVFHHVDVTGSAQTAYSGTQSIVADSFGGSYRLRESGRGNGVNTYDMNEQDVYGNAVDFTDNDNVWNNANAQLDEYATDAHWGAEMTYDYYWLEHGRNSIDGNGFTLNSYVHYNAQYANAFWDGQRMTYGDGNGGSMSPLTAIDIAGHEVTHGLTTFTANLVYAAESGALNESFSDIFGTAIENYALPSNWDWLIGEDIGVTLRSMDNPGAYGDPDTYFGNNWASLTGPDNGGVHTNSGVQNYWYYLLVTGGSGTNDNGDNYTVSSLGFTDASAIAFRNLTVYLGPSSDFAEARFYAIQSAVDLFGGCTPEVEACTNAWYAVGVGPEYTAGVTADMSAPLTSGCSAPFTVDFSNSSMNGTTFEWDFGDGNTSTDFNPSHTYTGFGTYTVQLIADGGLCGIDTTIWVNYIDVDGANPCEVIMPAQGTADLQTGCSGTLYDSGGSSGNYGPDEDAIVVIEPIGAATVDINFTFFDVEAGQSGSCNYDYVRVFDGPNTTYPQIDVYCNNNTPSGVISSTGDAITIEFHSDGGLEEAGYTMTWNCVLPTVPPVADFVSSVDTTCSGDVLFTDLSTNGPSQWNWDFGDGNTSTQQNPSHNYTSNGTYSVTLTATNLNGNDVQTYTNMIYVNLPTSPTGADDNVCENNTATLSATGTGGDLKWYDQQFGGTLLNTGASYTTVPLSTTTSFWVEEDTPGAASGVGPADNTFGGGGFFNGDQHLVFDVTTPVTLKTVRVFANGDGDRYIELRNSAGTVVQAATVFIPDGESVINLDFDLAVGTDWQLGTQPNSGQDLYRNNSGPSFPYVAGNGAVTITQSSPGTGYYYFFYDWVIEEPGCTSARTEVIANVSPGSDATITPVSPMCSSDAAITLTAVDGGGTWSGPGVSGSTFDPSVAGNGTHTIDYVISGSCGDSDQITIDVADSYDATITSPGVLCDDDAALNIIAVDAGGTWSGTGITDAGTGTFDPTIAGAGTHTITYDITGSCGDTDTEDIIVEERADATIDPAGPFCRYEPVQQMTAMDAGGTWSADCGSCIDATTGEFDPVVAGSGIWTITYSIGGNCPDSDQTTVLVNDCLSIEENAISFELYPNPNNGNFIISFTSSEERILELVDVTGKLIYTNKLTEQLNEIALPLSIAEGTYFVRISGVESQSISIQPIVINR